MQWALSNILYSKCKKRGREEERYFLCTFSLSYVGQRFRSPVRADQGEKKRRWVSFAERILPGESRKWAPSLRISGFTESWEWVMNGWPVGIWGTKAFCCSENGSKSNVVCSSKHIGVGALKYRKINFIVDLNLQGVINFNSHLNIKHGN